MHSFKFCYHSHHIRNEISFEAIFSWAAFICRNQQIFCSLKTDEMLLVDKSQHTLSSCQNLKFLYHFMRGYMCLKKKSPVLGSSRLSTNLESLFPCDRISGQYTTNHAKLLIGLNINGICLHSAGADPGGALGAWAPLTLGFEAPKLSNFGPYLIFP